MPLSGDSVPELEKLMYDGRGKGKREGREFCRLEKLRRLTILLTM